MTLPTYKLCMKRSGRVIAQLPKSDGMRRGAGPANALILTLRGAPPEPVLLGWGFADGRSDARKSTRSMLLRSSMHAELPPTLAQS